MSEERRLSPRGEINRDREEIKRSFEKQENRGDSPTKVAVLPEGISASLSHFGTFRQVRRARRVIQEEEEKQTVKSEPMADVR